MASSDPQELPAAAEMNSTFFGLGFRRLDPSDEIRMPLMMSRELAAFLQDSWCLPLAEDLIWHSIPDCEPRQAG
jgi:hypothetical protein